jgi:hypothetical protein
MRAAVSPQMPADDTTAMPWEQEAVKSAAAAYPVPGSVSGAERDATANGPPRAAHSAERLEAIEAVPGEISLPNNNLQHLHSHPPRLIFLDLETTGALLECQAGRKTNLQPAV